MVAKESIALGALGVSAEAIDARRRSPGVGAIPTHVGQQTRLGVLPVSVVSIDMPLVDSDLISLDILAPHSCIIRRIRVLRIKEIISNGVYFFVRSLNFRVKVSFIVIFERYSKLFSASVKHIVVLLKSHFNWPIATHDLGPESLDGGDVEDSGDDHDAFDGVVKDFKSCLSREVYFERPFQLLLLTFQVIFFVEVDIDSLRYD